MAEKKKTVIVEKQPNVTSGLVTMGGKHVNGFVDFIRTQGVIGLAVGLLLGTAAGLLVRSLIDNVIMPPVGLWLGSSEGLDGLAWTIGSTDGAPVSINYGIFLNDLISFAVIALVVYIVFHALGLNKLDKKKD